jgi:hypothetical protein
MVATLRKQSQVVQREETRDPEEQLHSALLWNLIVASLSFQCSSPDFRICNRRAAEKTIEHRPLMSDYRKAQCLEPIPPLGNGWLLNQNLGNLCGESEVYIRGGKETRERATVFPPGPCRALMSHLWANLCTDRATMLSQRASPRGAPQNVGRSSPNKASSGATSPHKRGASCPVERGNPCQDGEP